MPNYIRSHERIDFRRCEKKWYWKWREGLVPRAKAYGALEFGTWLHAAFALWYGPGYTRNGSLQERFTEIAEGELVAALAAGAPEQAISDAEKLAELGIRMTAAYEEFYDSDSDLWVIAAERPLQFDFAGTVYKFKPDLIVMHKDNAYLVEHKSARTIRTRHLSIDDQARPYAVLAERSLRQSGLIDDQTPFYGVIYNFLRKSAPDVRPRNDKGQYLNKNGSVSARQPSPFFVRHLVRLSNKARVRALHQMMLDVAEIGTLAEALRNGTIIAQDLPITPHYSCPTTCQFFTICEMEESGLSNMADTKLRLYTRQDPYIYPESTDDPMSFELG